LAVGKHLGARFIQFSSILAYLTSKIATKIANMAAETKCTSQNYHHNIGLWAAKSYFVATWMHDTGKKVSQVINALKAAAECISII